LIGTDTIDLYKPSRLEMKRGVRHVNIRILQWGSEEQSLKVSPRAAKHSWRTEMVAALEKKKGQKPSRNLLRPALRFDLTRVAQHFPADENLRVGARATFGTLRPAFAGECHELSCSTT